MPVEPIWGLTPDKWAAVGSAGTLFLAILTAFLVAVGLAQIIAARKEALKTRTLVACDRYITDPVLDATLHRLSEGRVDGTLLSSPTKFYTDIRTLLDYLDSLAVGATQGLYIENLMRDHLEPVVKCHVEQYLVGTLAPNYGLNPANFEHLMAMYQRWSQPESLKVRFKDK